MRPAALAVKVVARGQMAEATRHFRRVLKGASVALLVFASWAMPGASLADPPDVALASDPPRLKPSVAERAKTVLGVHCADCRALYGEGNALDLRALAADPGLIAPGHPDASRAYQRLLAPPIEEDAAEAGSAPDDIEAVRDWIAALPPRDAACAGRKRITPNDVAGLVQRWKALIGEEEAAHTRFVSLAHLWNACVPPAELMEARVAIATVLGVMTHRREGLNLETLGDASALLAVNPGKEPLRDAGWNALEAEAPKFAYGVVPADWLAAHVLAEAGEGVGPASPNTLRFDGVAERAISALARFWSRDVDLVRAAAERGEALGDLKKTLTDAEGALLVPSRRLAYGALPRTSWQWLSAALDGGPTQRTNTQTAAEHPSGSLDIVLWPDDPFYRPRDLVTFNVEVSEACYLTLIGVDGEGEAIVLYPNELEQQNLIAPRVTVKVPGHDAGYQFRFDTSGEERVVAICQRHRHRPVGIEYDFDRQRFSILGKWRTFLSTAAEREKKIVEARAKEEARRKRRRRPPLDPEPKPLDGSPEEARTAIAITVHPGGTAAR